MKAKNLSILILLLQVLIFAQNPVPPSAGDGTLGNPYQIATLDNLYWIASSTSNWNKCFIQTTDIDASGTNGWFPDGSGGFYGWVPIGNNTIKFTGSYNGQNHFIDGLYLNRKNTSNAGLFGYAQTGSMITGLNLTDVYVKGYYSTGTLVGYNSGTVNACHASGTTSGQGSVGGLAGSNSGLIQYSTSSAVVYGVENKTGGLAGDNYKGSVDHCSASGTVTGSSYLGGLIGENYSGTIINSFSTGTVSGSSLYVGGFAGSSWKSDTATYIRECYSTSPSVTGDNAIGGFIGQNTGEITNCRYDNSTGTVTGFYGGVGGFAGSNEYSTGVISDCHTNASVSFTIDGNGMGGFVNYNNQATIINSYATGNVSGAQYVGGFVGCHYQGSIYGENGGHCYSTGTVSGTDYVGGFAGDVYNNSLIANSYSTSAVTATGDYSGGLAGRLSGNTWTARSYATNCYFEGSVTNTGTGKWCIGGLIGWCIGEVTDCYSGCTVTAVAASAVGGLIGGSEGIVSNSFTTGTVSGDYEAGGFCGYIWGSNSYVSNCYTQSDVTGNEEVGAFAGWNSEDVLYCYAAGRVTGAINTAAFVGLDGGGIYTACFVDTDKGGITGDMVGNVDPDPAGVAGMTTPQMNTKSNFTDAGWDFVGETVNGTNDLWNQDGFSNGGYPWLSWQNIDLVSVSVNITISGSNPQLKWNEITGATSYKIYSSTDPYLDFSTWDIETTVLAPELSWTDEEALETKKFYIVTAVK